MKTNHALALLLLLVLASAGGWYFHQDYQFRSEHGIVTDVTYRNWDAEVDKEKDSVPVLVYFYNSAGDNHARQNPVVESFAWDNAGEVKVVRMDISKPENLLLAIALGAFREPAFTLIAGEDVVLGPAGVVVNQEQLENLLK